MPSSSVLLARHLTLEIIGVETITGVDAQGLPTYAASQNIQARAQREDIVIDGAGVGGTSAGSVGVGTRIKIELSVWIPDGQSPMPGDQDRITRSSEQFIVVEQKDVLDRNGVRVHRRVRCRKA